MNPVDWLRQRLFTHRTYSPTDDPEVRELAERVAELELKTGHQDERLSNVEARVGVRNPALWRVRDTG